MIGPATLNSLTAYAIPRCVLQDPLGRCGNASTSGRHGLGHRPATRPAFIKIHQKRHTLTANHVDQFGISHDRADRSIRYVMSMPV